MIEEYRKILNIVGMPGIKDINEFGEFIYNSNDSRGIYSSLKGNVINGGVICIENNIDIFSTSTFVGWLRVYNINNMSFHLQVDEKNNIDKLYSEILEAIKNDSFYKYICEIPRGICVYSKEEEYSMINQLNNNGIKDVELIGNFGSFVGKSEFSDFSYEGIIDKNGYFYLEYSMIEQIYILKGEYNDSNFTIKLDEAEDIKDLFRYLKEEINKLDIIKLLETLPSELCKKISINSGKKLIKQFV